MLKTLIAIVQWFTHLQIKDAQIRDTDLSRFIEVFNGHTEKPKTKLLPGESSDVKILCSLWKVYNTRWNLVQSR